ncbi:hypothetical protein ACJRO7_023458 [Eucalyptus globulus]|uniref:Uncharacterized protein n=1 Tax=Eucalyptus globulus TaxID=34317 RepID=A0ABD3K5E8_EUCGL
MGASRTEVNLRRLLVAAPEQENQAKLANYIATLGEQLEQLAEERTPDRLPRSLACPLDLCHLLLFLNEMSIGSWIFHLCKSDCMDIFLCFLAMVIDYSEKIEAITAKSSAPFHDVQEPQEPFPGSSSGDSPKKELEDLVTPKSGLRSPTSSTAGTTQSHNEVDTSGPVKLDAAVQAHIEKHRKLQEDLTDEMAGLARRLKESSLVMSQSLQNTEKILDSMEKVVEHRLASTNQVNVWAMEIYSESSKTTCFTWLLIFTMTCIFILVVLLIGVT